MVVVGDTLDQVVGVVLVRDALVPVYAAMDLAWDPGTAGSLQDADPSITLARTADAVLEELAQQAHLTRSQLDQQTLDLGSRLAPEHLSPTRGAGRAVGSET